jgi:hypothetical protein
VTGDRRGGRVPADCWTVLGAAVVALAARGAGIRLDTGNIEQVQAAADALFDALTAPADECDGWDRPEKAMQHGQR